MATKTYWFVTVTVLAWQCTQLISGYRPVIIMHGILSNAESMTELVQFVKKAHPGTEVYNVDIYNDLDSLEDMWTQVKGVQAKIQPFVTNATDGVNMICYSQGGLICRGILEMYSNNVKTFISLSSPQAGQYGDTEYLKFLFPNLLKESLYLIFYTDLGQDLSVANYWNDPHHQDLYMKYCNFLPPLTSEATAAYKTNFLTLEQLILIGGPDDGVITPWQSSHFGFYDENEKVLPPTSQDFYVKDTFGLRTLNETGRVKVFEIPGVQHLQWHTNQSVFNCCMEPYLK